MHLKWITYSTLITCFYNSFHSVQSPDWSLCSRAHVSFFRDTVEILRHGFCPLGTYNLMKESEAVWYLTSSVMESGHCVRRGSLSPTWGFGKLGRLPEMSLRKWVGRRSPMEGKGRECSHRSLRQQTQWQVLRCVCAVSFRTLLACPL